MFLFQEENVVTQVGALLNGEKIDAVICVAGGWAGGNAASKGNFLVYICLNCLVLFEL
jgi:dihydropteridine reductase